MNQPIQQENDPTSLVNRVRALPVVKSLLLLFLLLIWGVLGYGLFRSPFLFLFGIVIPGAYLIYQTSEVPRPRVEPRWVPITAGLGTALIAGNILVVECLSRYTAEALLGAGTFSEEITRELGQEVIGYGKPPGYPTFLLLTEKVVGQDALVGTSIVLQMGVAWATLMALFFIARRSTGSSALAVISVALVSFNGLWVDEMVEPRETFLYGAAILGLVSLVVYAPKPSRFSLFTMGLACALGWLTRPTGVVLFPALCVLFTKPWSTKFSEMRSVAVVIILCGLSLPMFGWQTYQYTTCRSTGLPASACFGVTRISGNDSATNLLKGQNEALKVVYPYVDVDRLAPVLTEPLQEAAIQNGEDVEQRFINHALNFVVDSPLDAIALVPKKLVAFFAPLHFPLGSGTIEMTGAGQWHLQNYRARPIRRADNLTALPGVLAFFFVLFNWTTVNQSMKLTTVIVGLTAIVHVVTFAETRFRLPYDPILALLFVQVIALHWHRFNGVKNQKNSKA
mgnify:CR=1 FL=1